MNINVLGVLLGAQRAARHMKAHGGGSIINTSSTAGINAGAGLITYRATKAAVIHITRSIALDLAQYSIRVNCLVPGQIQTAMTTYDMDTVMKFTQPLPRQGQAGGRRRGRGVPGQRPRRADHRRRAARSTAAPPPAPRRPSSS